MTIAAGQLRFCGQVYFRVAGHHQPQISPTFAFGGQRRSDQVNRSFEIIFIALHFRWKQLIIQIMLVHLEIWTYLKQF